MVSDRWLCSGFVACGLNLRVGRRGVKGGEEAEEGEKRAKRGGAAKEVDVVCWIRTVPVEITECCSETCKRTHAWLAMIFAADLSLQLDPTNQWLVAGAESRHVLDSICASCGRSHISRQALSVPDCLTLPTPLLSLVYTWPLHFLLFSRSRPAKASR